MWKDLTNKNFTIGKIIPYSLILLILAGLFNPMVKVDAQGAGAPAGTPIITPTTTPAPINNLTPAQIAKQTAEDAKKVADKESGNALYDSLTSCPPIDGCIVRIIYWLFYYIPSFLLGVVANFFNTIIALTIQSDLYTKATFVRNAWTVVRDFSNIFFILVLLYIAIQTILGLGHETKKMIAKVVIMALLINFSIFFTKVVIDSSNILALIFYNKINVTVVKNGITGDTNYIPVLAKGTDKDMTGKMMAYFDPTKVLTKEFFDKFRKSTYTFSVKGAALAAGGGALVGSWIPIVGTGIGAVAGVVGYALSGFANDIPLSIMAGFIIIAGLIIIFATYAFFITGLSFLARMIELWVLIIFSPFAFMSWTIPKLAGVEYIGWESWIKRLLKTAFMAPIFMFFLYLIFMIIQSNIFISSLMARNEIKQTWMETTIFMIIPALVILILLLKATKFAKEASGKLGEMMISGANLVTGLAVGGAALGGASILRTGIGRFMKGASTGDTAARRIAAERASGVRDTNLGRFERLKGHLSQKLGVDYLQQKVGAKLNKDQHDVEHAGHARHDLDKAANELAPGKKWEELNGQQRYEVRRQIARDRVIRDHAPSSTAGTLVDPVTGYATGGFGTRGWDKLSTQEREAVDRSAGVGNDPVTGHAMHGGALDTHTTVADKLITDARRKQDIISNVIQSSVTGSYDIRNLANVIAKEQSTGFAKFAAGLTGAIAMGMRGGFKLMGVNYGESQRNFFKDLGNTVTEALKSAKINVDLSHVGEVKKEDSKGGGGHH